MSTRKPNKPEENEQTRQGASEEEPIRHKGPDRTTSEEKHSGQQPDGNGATGEPAAFPPHN
ncbi:hypothetical protein ACLESD_33975 [Pyxidicoccus sp. 3LFB2]